MIVTIDGPSVSGKGTLARLLAQEQGIYYLDTGSLYRSLAYVLSKSYTREAIDAGVFLHDEVIRKLIASLRYEYFDGKAHTFFNSEEITMHIRTKEIDWYASHISQHSLVRIHLRYLQRTIGKKYDLVTDGRDCGTVIFPYAEYKIFLTASLEARVQRLIGDGSRKNAGYTVQRASQDILQRDLRDMTRTESPLCPADDAVIIDNSCLSMEETVQFVLQYIC